MAFQKKPGLLSSKYLFDGCEFKKNGNNYKLVETNGNDKYSPFINRSFGESAWNLISKSDITYGEKHTQFLNSLIKELKEGKPLFKEETDIILKKGEEVLFIPGIISVTLSEPRAVRVTKSSGAGASYKVNNKIRVGGGGGKSVSKSYDEITSIDNGKFIITNKRLIFIGNKKNVDVNLSQITSATVYQDGFILQRKNKQKPEYFTGFSKFVGYRTFNNEKYFYILSGEIVKAAIQGAINPVDSNSTNKLTAGESNKTKETKPITVNFDEISFSYNNDWFKLDPDEIELFMIGKTINNKTAAIKFHKNRKNSAPFEEIKEYLIKQLESQGNTIKNSKIETINNIKMVFIELEQNKMESIVTYFEGSEKGYVFTYMSNKGMNIENEYMDLLKTITISEKIIDEEKTSNRSIDDLMKYAELYEKGLLTKEEFEKKKQELL